MLILLLACAGAPDGDPPKGVLPGADADDTGADPDTDSGDTDTDTDPADTDADDTAPDDTGPADTDPDTGPPDTGASGAPPVAPRLALVPAAPAPGEPLDLWIGAAVDPDGDPVTTTIAWYRDGAPLPALDGATTVDGAEVLAGSTIRAVVTVTDGRTAPVTAEASVTAIYGCDALPATNFGERTLPDTRAWHGLTFDDAGHLYGYDGRGALVRATYEDGMDVFLPGVGIVQQLDRFSNGDLVYVDNTDLTLVRVDPATGASTVIATDLGTGYGVNVGPDDKVYLTYPDVRRVDPATGTVTPIVGYFGQSVRVSAFNLDSTVLYMGTVYSGDIWAVALDADLNPVGEPWVYAADVGGWHDGLTVDACGDLWVADYDAYALYRVTPDGTVTSMATEDATAYGHGVVFGSGVGGWRADAIYQPKSYDGNTVREVIVGVRSGDTVRTWNGVPTPW